MSPRPDAFYQSVDNDISLEDLSASGRETASDEGGATMNLSSDRIQSPVVPDMGGRTTFRTIINDVCLLAGNFIMLLWPWIFLCTIWGLHGIQMGDHLANVMKNHPQRTSFFITLFANIVCIIVSILFSTAVVRFSRQWTTNNDHVTVFDISLISAFRNQSWPWEMQDHKYLLDRKRWLPVVLAGVCIAAFAVVPSGTTSLITPVPFQKIWNLTGTELDFPSVTSSPDGLNQCLHDLFADNLTHVGVGYCTWNSFNGTRYRLCDDVNQWQLVNVLESGRSSIQSLFSNNSETLVLAELGANSSLRFLGPNRGVLPIGPNSIPGLDTLQHSPLSDAGTNAAILSYNYTLHHQGFTSSISCINDTQSPITYSAAPRDDFLIVTGSCDATGLHDPLALEYSDYLILNTDSTLAFWGCYSRQDQVYYIYLRGHGQIYETEIGNISCSVSQIQPAVFPVTYQSSTNIFWTQEPVAASAPPSNFSSDFVAWLIKSLLKLLINVQNPLNHPVAESVKDLGIQALWPQPPNDQYLPLYEAMMQGMLMDMITYARFIYSMELPDTPPVSCIRTVDGTMSAEVTGWVAKPVHVAFLMPMTILNIASLLMASISIAKAKRSRHSFDPTDLRSLVLAESRLNESEPSGWSDDISYRSRELAACQGSTRNASERPQSLTRSNSVPSSSSIHVGSEDPVGLD